MEGRPEEMDHAVVGLGDVGTSIEEEHEWQLLRARTLDTRAK